MVKDDEEVRATLVLRGLRCEKVWLARRFASIPPRRLEAILEELHREGLESDLHYFSWESSRLHQLTLELLRFKPERLEQAVGLHLGSYENLLRLCCYLNDTSRLAEIARQPTVAGSWALRYFLPLDIDFLGSRRGPIQTCIWESLAPALWQQDLLEPELQALLLEHASPLFRFQLRLARGQFAEARALLDSALKRQGGEALLAFFEGDVVRAHQLFQKKIQRRKENTAALPSWHGLFARLAALRCGDLESMADRRLSAPDYGVLDSFLSYLALHLRHGLPEAHEVLQHSLFEGPRQGFSWAIARSVEALLAGPLGASAELAGRLHRQGLQVFADQLQAHPRNSWGAGLQPKERWRSWLETLAAQAQLRATPGPELGLLSWHLDQGRPRPRRYHPKTGKFSEVKLSTLVRQPPESMSEQDLRILSRLDQRTYGNYLDVQMTPESIAAMVGHPQLYWDLEPCQLVEVHQCICIDRDSNGFQLRLEPRFESHEKFRCQLVEPGLAVFYRPGPWNEVLAPLFSDPQTIPYEEEESLRQSLMPWLGKIDFRYAEGVRPLAEVLAPPPAAVILRIVPHLNGLRFTWVVRPLGPEGPTLPAVEGPERETLSWGGQVFDIQRQLRSEQEAWYRYLQVCPQLPEELDFVLPELNPALEVLMQLQEAQVPVEWPQGQSWKVRPAQAPQRVQLNLLGRADNDWFELQGELRIDEEEVCQLGRALELARLYPGRFLRLSDSDFVEIQQKVHEQLLALEELVDSQRQELRMPALLAPVLNEVGVSFEASLEFQAALDRLDEAATLTPAAPAQLRAQLRDYQLEGFQWLARHAHSGAGACLADDMGLGKTIQLLALMLHTCQEGPHLVVCPTSVLSNWQQQAQAFAPQLRVHTYEGKERRTLIAALGPGDVLLCSYRIVLQDRRELAAIAWNVGLLDEAQFIKNPRSQTAQACFSLQVRRRVVTSGTPIENSLSELWSLFNYLNPGLLGTLSHFRRRYESPQAVVESASQRRLRRLIAPFVLRRLKSQVLHELPARTEVTLQAELSASERALYERLRRDALAHLERRGDALRILAHITRMRQACCHPGLVLEGSPPESAKFQLFFELCEDLRAGGHRALVFSQFTRLLDLLELQLQERGYRFLRLDGSTPGGERRRRVEAFQEGQAELFLISLKAGGTGLNLTAADYVVHLDPWWNPAAEDQASDRAHRIGQLKPVTIYRLIARDTIEEKVVHLHRDKRELAEQILEGREEAVHLSAAELRALIL